MIHQNSITSFEQLSFKAGLSQSEKVYHALEILGPQTDRELGSSTGIPYHLIPRCRGPLMSFDSIKQAGSKTDPITNRTVSVWATTKSLDQAASARASEAVRQVMANAPSQSVQSGGLFGLLVAVALCLLPFQAEAKTIVVKQTVRTVYAKEVKTVKLVEKKVEKKKVADKVSIVPPTYSPLTDSKIEVAKMIRDTFPDNARTMIAIAMAESGLRCEAINHADTNGVQSVGLFQINDGRYFTEQDIANLTTCSHNLERAKQKYTSQGLSAWGAFTNGAYRRYLWIFETI